MNRDLLHKRLAIMGAILAAALFVAANAHLVTVAFQSQPACVMPAEGHAPATQDC